MTGDQETNNAAVRELIEGKASVMRLVRWFNDQLRGRVIYRPDGGIAFGMCSVCGAETVNPEGGEDTCSGCTSKV